MSATRLVLITGANRGLGFATARQLGAAGHHVILGARDPEQGREALSSLQRAGAAAETVQLDVTDARSIRDAVLTVEQQHGRLDVLVNNAAIGSGHPRDAPPEAVSQARFRAVFDTNVHGALAMIQACLPLLAQARSPRIVNVSSTLGSLSSVTDPAHPYHGVNPIAYAASKAALNALTVGFGKALADRGIAVVSVCPGWVRTDLGGDAAARSPEEGARVIVRVATMDDPPTAAFLDADGTVPW